MMLNGGRYVIRTIISGFVVEKSKFWLPNPGQVRAARSHTTSARKQDKNANDAVKQLARQINCNFGYRDLWVLLEYDEAGYAAIDGSREAAQKELKLFIRRLGRAMKKDGLALRYAGACTSDMDGNTKTDVRVHHHIVLPREAEPYLEQCWTRGGYGIRTLRRQADYTGIARYIIRQVRRIPDAKKWSSSRNLEKPVVYERAAKRAGALRNPTKTILLESSEYDVESGSHYIRYTKAPTPGETGLRAKDVTAAPETAQKARGRQ